MRAASPALVLAAAVLAGSAMDATIKHLTLSNHVLIVSLGRYVCGGLVGALIWRQAGAPRVTMEMLRVHLARGALLACGGMSFFWALSVLPLAEAVALSFVGALLIPVAAWLMLGERLRPRSIIAIIVGFIGVLVAVQGMPGGAHTEQHLLGIGAVLVASLVFAVSTIIIRARAPKDGAAISGWLASATPALFVAPLALALAPPPDWSTWPGFVLLGVFAGAFMYLMAHAYGASEAQRLAPIHYTELIWASLIGFVLFRETPRPEVYLGAVLIVAACLYPIYAERRTRHTPA